MRTTHRNGVNRHPEGDGPPLGTCTAIMGPMTQAMKAQAVLGEAAIRTSIIKISSSTGHNGCAYGVEYPCTQQQNVRMILNQASIKVRDFGQGGER